MSNLPPQLKGARLGYLTFVKHLGYVHKNAVGEFVCKCGSIVTREYRIFHKPSVHLKSCGKCQYKRIKDPDADYKAIFAENKKRNKYYKPRKRISRIPLGIEHMLKINVKPKHESVDECIGVRRRVKKSSITVKDMSEPVRLALCTAWR